MIYYKTLHKDGRSPFAGVDWYLPNGKPGDWMPRVKTIVECQSGYHICRQKDLIYWIGETVYTVEVRGRVYRYGEKCACHQARLVSKIETWTGEMQSLVAADIAELVLPIFEKQRPEDSRPRDAINATRRFALGEIDRNVLRLFYEAAADASQTLHYSSMFAAHAAQNAASDSPYRACLAADRVVDARPFLGRGRQTKILFQYLNRPVSESLEIARAKLEAA